MVTVLLVRHATCDHVGLRIAGRMPGVGLNRDGLAEAEALAVALSALDVDGIYSGPLERARETADVLAERLGQRTRVAAGLDEIDFGAWTGRTLASLADDPLWEAFNQQRDTTRPPGGELMAEAVARAAADLDRFRTAHPTGTVIAVSHGDVIRGVLLRCLGLPMGAVHRLEVSPASVSVVRLWPNGSQVAAMNWVPVAVPR